jgi:hypothetical protein
MTGTFDELAYMVLVMERRGERSQAVRSAEVR